MIERSTYLLTAVLSFAFGGALSMVMVHGQSATKIDREFTHISLAVSDVDKTSKAIAALFGLPAPEPRIIKDIPFPPSYGNKTMIGKVASVTANGLRIEMIQPITSSPWKDFIDKHGDGIHHVGWSVSNYAEAVKFLESKGGKWVQGNVRVNFGYVDMSPASIPFAIEVVGEGGPNLPSQEAAAPR